MWAAKTATTLTATAARGVRHAHSQQRVLLVGSGLVAKPVLDHVSQFAAVTVGPSLCLFFFFREWPRAN